MSGGVDVVCVGILVADLFAPPLARLPDVGELLKVDDFLLTVGGCAANTGIDLARLGASVAVVGKVGDDMAGEFIMRTLAAQGVDPSGIRRSATAQTSRTVILPVTGQDRRYIHAVGANADLTVDDIDLVQVRNARVLYVGGYFLMPGLQPQALAALLADAHQHGVITMLDVAGVPQAGGMEQLEPVLRHSHVFLPNFDEALLLTGCDDPVQQAQQFLACGVGTVAITLGAKGAVVANRDQTLQIGAFAVDVLDPSGGGDAFDAGFIVGLLEGWDLAHSTVFASAIGASACTQLGCTAGVFTREQANAFIAVNQVQIHQC